MSFSPFSFNPTSVKNDSMKYFAKRQTEMYILRYRCPNDEVFDPMTHLGSLKSVFLTANQDASLNSDSSKKEIAENILTEDLLSLAISTPPELCIENTAEYQQKNKNMSKQHEYSLNEKDNDSNPVLHHKTHTLIDELTQSDIYYINNSNDILKLIFRLIKEKNYTEAFENINKSINIYSQYEMANYNIKKKDISGIILYTAFVGLLLSYSIHDEEKQYEYFGIISDYPIHHSDLPHFYHLIDEILVTNNGIKQFTLAHLLGFPSQFFIPTNQNNQIKSSFRSKRFRNRPRSSIRRNDAVFNHIINKKLRLGQNEHDYDNDDFNDDYSENDYDYYDFDSDSEFDFNDNFDSIDDFDYNFHHHSQQAIDDMPPDIKKEFFNKTFRLHEKKKLLDMKLKKKMLKEELNSSKKSVESNNNNNNNNNNNVKDKKEPSANQCNNNDMDSSQWKVVANNDNDSNTKKNNISLFGKGSVDEIQIAPILNVVFSENPNIPSLPRINQYYAYKASNSSKIVNCNFIPTSEFSRYVGFDDKEYNYCCLPHFIQPDIPKLFSNDEKSLSESKPTYAKGKNNIISNYIRITEAKDSLRSLADSSLKSPMPILTCSIQSDDENDENLAAEIEAAIAKPNLFMSSKQKSKSKMFLRPPQERIEEFMDSFNPSCDFLRGIKPNINQKNIKTSTKSESASSFRSSFGSDDDDFDEDANYAIFNNMLKKDIVSQPHEAFQILSQINPLFSSLKNEKISDQVPISSKKSYIVQSPGTKTTTEIKKIGNGTTITKITTTSNIKFQNGNLFSDDDIATTSNSQPMRSSKDKKKKRRDGK